MLRNAQIRYRVARGAGQSILHSLGFALFNVRPPAVRKRIEDENRALRVDLREKMGRGARDGSGPSPPSDVPERR
jgi:hypothetical protein